MLFEPDEKLHAILTGEAPHEAVSMLVDAREKLGSYLANRKWNGSLDHEPWLKIVDGAKLLADTFDEVTEKRLLYRKTKHSVEICRKILQTDPGHLADVRSFLVELLKIAARDTAP
jgi:hypothetical protein